MTSRSCARGGVLPQGGCCPANFICGTQGCCLSPRVCVGGSQCIELSAPLPGMDFAKDNQVAFRDVAAAQGINENGCIGDQIMLPQDVCW